MTKEGSFAALQELKGTGRRELAGEAGSAPLPAVSPPPATYIEQAEVTRPLSAQIPESLKLEFDQRMLDARRSGPGMGKTEYRQAIAAMIMLLREDGPRERWLELMREMRRA